MASLPAWQTGPGGSKAAAMTVHDADGDFDETELMFEGSAATTVHELAAASELSEEDKSAPVEESDESSSDSDFDADDEALKSFRTGGMSIGSAEASDTRSMLHGSGGLASLPVSMGAPSPRMPMPQRPEHMYGSMAGRAVSHGFGMGSMPAGSLKLGTSMPITIPLMARNQLSPTDREDDEEPGQKFVPPHEYLEQSLGGKGSSLFSGPSPGASFKREKLLMRNAILRSTGFIEGQVLPKGALAEVLDPIKESHLERRDMESRNTSMLSQALVSSPMSAAPVGFGRFN